MWNYLYIYNYLYIIIKLFMYNYFLKCIYIFTLWNIPLFWIHHIPKPSQNVLYLTIDQLEPYFRPKVINYRKTAKNTRIAPEKVTCYNTADFEFCRNFLSVNFSKQSFLRTCTIKYVTVGIYNIMKFCPKIIARFFYLFVT